MECSAIGYGAYDCDHYEDVDSRPGMQVHFITVWKFHDFSVTQILREIKYGASKNAKSAILAHLEALNFDFYEYSHSQF